jgi:hypothetical protein
MYSDSLDQENNVNEKIKLERGENFSESENTKIYTDLIIEKKESFTFGGFFIKSQNDQNNFSKSEELVKKIFYKRNISWIVKVKIYTNIRKIVKIFLFYLYSKNFKKFSTFLSKHFKHK